MNEQVSKLFVKSQLVFWKRQTVSRCSRLLFSTHTPTTITPTINSNVSYNTALLTSSANKRYYSGSIDYTWPYESIPGPKPLPVIGNTFIFTKQGGYPLQEFWQTSWKLQNKYGDVVKIERVRPDLDMVFLFDPNDIKLMFQMEKECPLRPPLDMLLTYRQNNPKLYTSMGMVSGNGPDWKRLRRAVPVMLKLDVVSSYKRRQAAVASELASALTHPIWSTAGPNGSYTVSDLLSLLFCYTLESIGLIALGRRQDCLFGRMKTAQEIIKANEEFLQVLGETAYSVPFYKIFPTPAYLKLKRASEHFHSVVSESLTAYEKQVHSSKGTEDPQPLINALLSNPSLSRKDILLILTEIFMGGIDATATTLAFALYFLSLSQSWQNKLRDEVANFNIYEDSFQNVPILRGVLKETYRLRPSPAGIARIVQEETVIGRFKIKPGVLLQSVSYMASMDQKYFENPHEFNPGRWIKTSQSYADAHPYSVLPFSHGMRMCPGRRIAEQEMMLALVKIIQKFRLSMSSPVPADISEKLPQNNSKEWRVEGIGQVLRLNMMPAHPISINFSPIN